MEKVGVKFVARWREKNGSEWCFAGWQHILPRPRDYSRGFIGTVSSIDRRPYVTTCRVWLEIKRNDEKAVTGKERKRLVKTGKTAGRVGTEKRSGRERDGGTFAR